MRNLLIVLLTLLPTSLALGAPHVDRIPDHVRVVTDQTTLEFPSGIHEQGGIGVALIPTAGGLRVELHAPNEAVRSVQLHWDVTFNPPTLFLGDAWERAYSDLQWRPMEPNRALPWYFLATAADHTSGFGVMTGPASLCCWTVDATGITLTADVRCGGAGVQLGDRTLNVCTVIEHDGAERESAFEVDVALCRQMCAKPLLPKQPVYGFNDWYCTYGHNTADGFCRDAAALAGLAPAGENRPFMVVDDGWQANRQGAKSDTNPWDRTNPKFGSTMPDLARRVKAMNARPGLWYRPLLAWPTAEKSQLLRGTNDVFDPSIRAVRERIIADMRRFHEWGFELVKHDFSTSEITGMWGSQMGDRMVHGDWAFADRSHTTAEIITELYKSIRAGGGDDMVIEGCNTVGHLSAGLFQLQRIGDDTSGTDFHRTVKYGVNCLAFRGPQQGTFFAADADCVGLAKAGAIPWVKNRQWLDLVARSGTPLFVSWTSDLLDDDTKAGLRAAFAAAAIAQPVGRPLDWTESTCPTRWMLDRQEMKFAW